MDSKSNRPNNKTIAGSFFLAQDRLRGGPAEELCSPSYTACIGSNPRMDLAGHQQFAAAFYQAFPDLKHTVEDVIGEGDNVVVRFRLVGNQTGDFMGIPATGRPISVSAQARMRLKDGRIEEVVGEFDQLGMLQQLGVIPSGE